MQCFLPTVNSGVFILSPFPPSPPHGKFYLIPFTLPSFPPSPVFPYYKFCSSLLTLSPSLPVCPCNKVFFFLLQSLPLVFFLPPPNLSPPSPSSSHYNLWSSLSVMPAFLFYAPLLPSGCLPNIQTLQSLHLAFLPFFLPLSPFLPHPGYMFLLFSASETFITLMPGSSHSTGEP